ncbi:hypothetical protein HOI18_03785 [Candidatus Uhrbacteria bacterium]|nr:hypothetical protein [Candidatus Uhrbacteria bacterium]
MKKLSNIEINDEADLIEGSPGMEIVEKHVRMDSITITRKAGEIRNSPGLALRSPNEKSSLEISKVFRSEKNSTASEIEVGENGRVVLETFPGGRMTIE